MYNVYEKGQIPDKSPIRQYTTQQSCQSVIQKVSLAIIQPENQPANRPVKKAMCRSRNESTKQAFSLLPYQPFSWEVAGMPRNRSVAHSASRQVCHSFIGSDSQPVYLHVMWSVSGLFVGCLTSQQQAIVYIRDGSAQTILRAATLR